MKSLDYVAITYDEKRTPKTDYPSQMAMYFQERFMLKPGSIFLELACGRGDFLRAFHDIGLNCSAVDISDSSVELNKVFGAKKCDVTCEKLPYEDNTFDIVYSKSLVEHMWDATFLMSEILRVLKHGGLCITLTPDWVSQMPVFYEDYTHCRPYTVDSLKDLMTTSGFNKVETEHFCQHPFIWRSESYQFLATILRLCISTPTGRVLTKFTRVKFFRWAVERMVLATGFKHT